METIESILESVNGYLLSIKRNTVNGWYELEVGIPKKWVFGETNDVKCETLNESAEGKLLKISPKHDKIIIDDLISFVDAIILTNEKIAEKEKQFTDKMEEMKGVLEKEAKKFYEELDELKENSFKTLTNDLEKVTKKSGEKKESKNKKPKPDDEIVVKQD
jgi:phenylalanyl-tRNA synthetase alpha subunit